MDYSSPLRRRLRQGRRFVLAATRRPMWRGGVVVPAFWWDGHPNFGDDMTPWLLPHYGLAAAYRSAGTARLAGIGSILEFLPEDWDGVVWGSGLMEERAHPLPRARFLAVRGELTRQLANVKGPVALGDPGILTSRHVRRPRPRWEVGIVPHGHHRSHRGLAELAHSAGSRVRVVNVHQGAAAAVREIASCSVVLTTSLHGLVVADSYGIPAVWTTLDPPLGGGDFKFRDYETALTPGTTRYTPYEPELSLSALLSTAKAPDAALVAQRGDDLERALARVVETLPGLQSFPMGVLAASRR
jgi:hypothetical protein